MNQEPGSTMSCNTVDWFYIALYLVCGMLGMWLLPQFISPTVEQVLVSLTHTLFEGPIAEPIAGMDALVWLHAHLLGFYFGMVVPRIAQTLLEMNDRYLMKKESSRVSARYAAAKAVMENQPKDSGWD